jgi:hypothetical protein
LVPATPFATAGGIGSFVGEPYLTPRTVLNSAVGNIEQGSAGVAFAFAKVHGAHIRQANAAMGLRKPGAVMVT